MYSTSPTVQMEIIVRKQKNIIFPSIIWQKKNNNIKVRLKIFDW